MSDLYEIKPLEWKGGQTATGEQWEASFMFIRFTMKSFSNMKSVYCEAKYGFGACVLRGTFQSLDDAKGWCDDLYREEIINYLNKIE